MIPGIVPVIAMDFVIVIHEIVIIISVHFLLLFADNNLARALHQQ